MSVAPHAIPFVLLATAGERLGWIYTDRNLYRREFTEPPPEPIPLPPEAHEQVDRAQANRRKNVKTWILSGIGLAIFVVGYGGYRAEQTSSEVSPFCYKLSFAIFVGGFVGAILASLEPYRARRALIAAQAKSEADHDAAQEAWRRRRDDHEQQQRLLIDGMPEWSAATPSPGNGRIDIIGGTTYGWEAVLTVHGGSLLATRGAMTLVDLTGDALCSELVQLATETGRSARRLRLPTDLAEFDLLAGLTPDELVDCLVEAMHGDQRGTGRADRSQDSLLLREIGEVLGSELMGAELSMARLVAALRVLTDRPDQAALTPDEVARLLDLHPDENRRQLYPQVRRIEAFLRPLEDMGRRAGGAEASADLTCLVADGEGATAQNELIKDLVLHWLTRLVRRGVRPMGSLVVLGADELHHRAIEKLSTLCDRNGVRLVLFFSHLRAEAVHTIGGGEVALMRLGNHHEANQAADYIGKGHKFVLSQLTRTTGGTNTHMLGTSSGEGEERGESSGTFKGKQRGTRQYGRTANASRNWGSTEQKARSTIWNDASTAQRVHEYTVEPRVLQDLPEYAMVLVKQQDRGTVVQAVEVDPAIVMLPRVSMHPRRPAPLPDPAEAVVPVARAAGAVRPAVGPAGPRP